MTARCHPACLDPACPACARAAAPADSKVAAAGHTLTIWRGDDGPEVLPAEMPASARAALALALAPEIDASLTRLRADVAHEREWTGSWDVSQDDVRAIIEAVPEELRTAARRLANAARQRHEERCSVVVANLIEARAERDRLRSTIAAARATIASIPPDERYPARHLLDRVLADLDGADGAA